MRGCTDVRLGLLAYSTNTGLGIQTLEFAEHMRPDRVLLVDMSPLNHTQQHPERYQAFDCVHTKGIPRYPELSAFLRGLDVVFVCETPLNYDLFKLARRQNVRTILQPNHEFNDYLCRPHLPQPDLFALPSGWHYDDLPYENKRLLRVPVATEKLKAHRRSVVRDFLHVAGRPAAHDRNGTRETIEAFRRMLFHDATLTVRVQGGGQEYRELAAGDPRITVDTTDIPNYWDGYEGFDCLVLPRKYGGLCLPMQEALGSGIPVIMTDVSPNNEVLPRPWLVPTERTGSFMARSEIDIHTADVDALAAKMDAFCLLGPDDAESTYAMALARGDELSWAALESEYREVIAEVARG
jgi:glycosyltransferase involved in cell wall biosynthesis